MKTLKKLYFTKIMPLLLVIMASPVALAFAEDTAKSGGSSSFTTNLVKWGATIAGAIVALALMISIVKDALEYSKGGGQSSPLKIIGKFLFMALMIGFIVLAQNYTTFQDKGKNIGNAVIDTVDDQVTNEILK